MEAAVATPEAPPEAEAERTTEKLFQYSDYVHVGEGVEECEHATDGRCRDGRHFHAWVCLPNTFQFRDIDEKARAAQARKVRALKDPESDSHAILEAELDDVRENQMDALVAALSREEVEKQLPAIVHELGKDERFEHHAQDAEEFRRQEAMPEEERDAEEFERLQADMQAWGERLADEMESRRKGEETRLGTLDPDELIARERKARIEQIGTEMYMHTYYTWAMYICTRRPVSEGHSLQRVFKEASDLRNAPPEAVVALRAKISDLEGRTTRRGDAAGN